jgi:KUP system potassium uptake protein
MDPQSPAAVPPAIGERPAPPKDAKEAPEPPPSGAPVTPGPQDPNHGHALLPLAIGALGIVYGDIGTSPLYAVKECFNGPHGVAVDQGNVLGVLSMMFWSLTMVVAFKYIGFIMRADNKGEGGIFALMALLPKEQGKLISKLRGGAILLGVFGAALLYGDGMITPAISVLSAMEGLEVATHAADKLVVPLTVGILIGLFLIQKRGTAGIGRLFGPVMVVWFVALAGLGINAILSQPVVLGAVNPAHALNFITHHGDKFLIVLGSIVLAVTGAEALYADMGHFGKRSIRVGWFALVFPSLVLNYMGQGAQLLAVGPNGAAVKNPFYSLVPEPLLIPMVVLATMAAVIASQAMISGAFSLTRQAVQLGFCPRVTIVHTSAKNEGQIFIPEVNEVLMVACVTLVLAFQKSSALAGAYGIAVTGTFCITSTVYFFVLTRTWKWPVWKALPLVLLFLLVDVPFLISNLLKLFDGGWIPLLVGMGIYALMTTWKTGRAEMARRFAEQSMPLTSLLEDIESHPPPRVRGTAIFMSGNPEGTPPVLLHHLKHNQVLHRQVVLLSVLSENVPSVPVDEQIEVTPAGQGFFRMVMRFGFMQTPNVPAALIKAREKGLVCEPSTTSYYLGRETLLTTGKSKMMRWRKALFSIVSRNAQTAGTYFGIPPGRVVELGMQVDL